MKRDRQQRELRENGLQLLPRGPAKRDRLGLADFLRENVATVSDAEKLPARRGHGDEVFQESLHLPAHTAPPPRGDPTKKRMCAGIAYWEKQTSTAAVAPCSLSSPHTSRSPTFSADGNERRQRKSQVRAPCVEDIYQLGRVLLRGEKHSGLFVASLAGRAGLDDALRPELVQRPTIVGRRLAEARVDCRLPFEFGQPLRHLVRWAEEVHTTRKQRHKVHGAG